MKILIINTIPTAFNGITNAIFNLLTALEGKEIEIDYVTIKEPDKHFRDIIEKKWGNLYVFPRNRKPLNYYMNLKRLIKSNKYDIVHVHGNSHTMVIEMLAAKKAGCPIRISHGQNSTCYNLFLHRMLTPLFRSTCNYGFACSENAGKFLFGNMPYIVLRNGIEMKKFAFNLDNRRKIREKLKIEDDCIVVGNVASMRQEKNHLFLLDVFHNLYIKNNKYRMILVGDGAERKKIEDRINELNLNEVIYLTGFADDSIYLSAMDLIVMPSIFEGLPISLIEEQTNGLTCFVSDCITKEIDTTNKNIFLSLQTGPEEWANMILKSNINRSKEFADYCYDKTQKAGFDIEDEADWIINYYCNLMTDNKSR